MSERQISRREILIGAGALGALSPILVPAAARANDQGGLVRWDLVQIVGGEVVAGGTDVANDTAGDTVSLTGSGQASADEGTAAGGGTFVARAASGAQFQGVYVVTGFKSFQNLGGSLIATPLVDGIGTLRATTGGILAVNVHFVATTGLTADGVLEVHCNLPGASPATAEGIRLTVSVGAATFTLTQAGGATLFHILAE